MVNGRFFGFVAATIAGCFVPQANAGPGDLLVSPVRIVFEGRDRVAEVTLVNKSDATAEYRIGFENRRMLDNGSFQAIQDEGEGLKFAEDYVRFAPRRVSLPPNTPQTIRLMLRKPEGLAEGEYRSHLRFAAVPDSPGRNSVEGTDKSASGLSIELIPIYGVTIPVIVRHGELSASAAFRGAKIRQKDGGRLGIQTTLTRVGEKSLYGDVSLHLENKDDSLTSLRGIAIYTPNTFRNLELDISSDLRKTIGTKNVQLRFLDRATGDVISTSEAFQLMP